MRAGAMLRSAWWAVMLVAVASSIAPAATNGLLSGEVTTRNGQAVGGCYVYVYGTGTTTLATLYTDYDGTVSAGNPVTTDANGEYWVYTVLGGYDVNYVHAGRQIDVWKYEVPTVGTGDAFTDVVADSLNVRVLVADLIDGESFDAIDVDGDVDAVDVNASDDVVAMDDVIAGDDVVAGADLVAGSDARVEGRLYAGLYESDPYEAWALRTINNDVFVADDFWADGNIGALDGNVYAYGRVGEAGRLVGAVAVVETIRAATATSPDIYLREYGSGHMEVLHTRFLQFDSIDVSSAFPGTSDYSPGTIFRGVDGAADSLYVLSETPKAWYAVAASGAGSGEDPVGLGYDPTTFYFDIAAGDTTPRSFGIWNTGDGTLNYDVTETCDWIADASEVMGGTSTGEVDSILITLKTAAVDTGASLSDTMRVTWDDGMSVVTCYIEGYDPLGGSYAIETAHPRLWFTEDTVDGLVAKCNSAMSSTYDTHKASVDATYLDPSYPLGDQGYYGRNMKMIGLCHLVEGASDTSYYHGMKTMVDYIWTQADWEQNRYYLDALAFAYDWAYSDLVGQSLDDNYGDSLAISVAWHTDNYLNWSGTNAGHSLLSRLRQLCYGGVALHGDGHTGGDAAATAACDTFYSVVFDDAHCIAMIDSIANDGGYFEGDYNRTVLKSFAEALWAFDSGSTNVALFDSTSCLAGWGDYIVWDTMCNSGLPSEAYAFGAGKQGDSDRHAGARGGLRHLINLLASTYQDSNVQWLEEQFAVEAPYWNAYERYYYILTHDTLMTGVSPVTAGWPEAKQYDVGTVFMRSGWDLTSTSTDLWAVYRHEQYPFGHAHGDVGHFTICRGQDILLPDTGVYVTSPMDHHEEYFTQTIAHNTITIKKSGETFPEASENTGGQQFQGGGEHPMTVGAYTDSMVGSKDGRGSITDFSITTDELVYVRSDMTDAYLSTKVDTVRREFAWLEEWDTFVIFDTVKLDSTGYLQKQLFHMIENPTTTSTTATWNEGDSQAKLTGLYGLDTLTEVGGTGAHYLCNGTNYTDATEEVEYDEGDYRIELAAARTADQRWMLSAVQVTNSASPSYETLALVVEGDYLGLSCGGDTLLFQKYGGTHDWRKH